MKPIRDLTGGHRRLLWKEAIKRATAQPERTKAGWWFAALALLDRIWP